MGAGGELRPGHFGWRVEARVATIMIARPERRNPLTFDSYAELTDTFRALTSMSDVPLFSATPVSVLTG